MEKRKERRIHQRFQAKDRAVAVLSSRSLKSDQIKCMSMGEITLEVYKSKPTQMGQIIDIGRGGYPRKKIAVPMPICYSNPIAKFYQDITVSRG